MTTQAIKSAAAPQARAIRIAPGLIFLLLLTLIFGASVASQFPRRVTPADAPAEVFSAERALAHLPVIAREPHPAGSAAQGRARDYLVSQLAVLGLKAEIQPFGGFENIAARLPGSDSTGAIVVLAHYDSVPGSPGAADNGAGVAALLEVARALSVSPPLRNDIIILFDDAEEGVPGRRPPFAGSWAFVQAHPWMTDIRMAISLDTAVAGPTQINDITSADRRLVQALAAVYRNGWTWSSIGGGGTYDNVPFREIGIQSLALEDNHAFRVQHTSLDRTEIVRPASLQQLGDQTLAITRQVGGFDLRLPWGAQETFIYFPLIGLVHYPESWTLPLAVVAGVLLLAVLGLALRRRIIAWRGLGIGFAAVLIAALLSAVVVGAIWSQIPRLLDWQVSDWPEWPEIVPPHAGWIIAGFAALSLAIAYAIYRLARRWSSQIAIALAALIPFAILALVFAPTNLRLAVLPVWPALIGSLAWLAFLGVARLRQASLDLPAWIVASFCMVHWPGILLSSYLSSGPSDLAILAALWVVPVFTLLPAIEGAVSYLPSLRSKLNGTRMDASADPRGKTI